MLNKFFTLVQKARKIRIGEVIGASVSNIVLLS
jgi:hypothetical protein